VFGCFIKCLIFLSSLFIFEIKYLINVIDRSVKSSSTFGIYILYSISYLCNDNILTRKVPDYHNKCSLYLTKVKFGFKSSASFPVRYGIKMIIGSIFNLGNWMKEFYEENLCYLFPCYELTYTLTKNENIISN
jgi:hypothetical protein